METQIYDLLPTMFSSDYLIIFIGSTIGSLKASLRYDTKDSLCTKVINILLGIFVGIATGFYFSREANIYLQGLLAVIGGASGAMVLEVFLELLPNSIGIILKKYLKDIKFK